MIDLKRVFAVVRRWWWLAAIPIVVVGIYTVATYVPPATPYQVVMRFIAGGQPASGLSSDYDRYYAWLSSEYVANALADLAVTEQFAQAVATRLDGAGLQVVPQALQGAIVTDNAQSVMVVYITWPDPNQARQIAEAVGAELLAGGPSYFPQMDNVGQVARLADAPDPHPLPPSLRARLLGPAIRLLIAAVFGAGLVLLAYVVDPRVHASDDLAAAGVPFLGAIPRR